MGLVENVGRDLSAGTEAAVVDWSAKPTSEFRYFIDRAVVTVFDSTMPWDRSGSEPDRFLTQMRELGVRVERPAAQRRHGPRNLAEERRHPGRDPVIATLDMLTLALGIRLPEDLAFAPLLTVRRDSP